MADVYLDEYISLGTIQLKRIKKDIDQERKIENKRNMREFIKNKCKKKGANYGKVL
jgi:hypothetical protein